MSFVLFLYACGTSAVVSVDPSLPRDDGLHTPLLSTQTSGETEPNLDSSDAKANAAQCSEALSVGCGTLATNRVIFLNGASSSGKTTRARALQDTLERPYLLIGLDTVIGMMPPKNNTWEIDEKTDGFWLKAARDADGHRLVYLHDGPLAHQMYELLRQLVLTTLEAGHNAIVDEVCLTHDRFQAWQEALAPYKTLYVGVTADIATRERREKQRGDRRLGLTRAQGQTVHQDNVYDLWQDTTHASPQVCAETVCAYLTGKGT